MLQLTLWCLEPFAAGLHVDSYKWIISFWETHCCVHHLHCILLLPVSPPLMRWCPLNIFWIHLDSPVFFVPAEIVFLTQSFVSPLSAGEPGVSVCVRVCVFSQCMMVDFGPSSPLGDHSWWYDASATAVMSKHSIFPKNVWFYFSPWLAPSLESPASTKSLSLLLASQSQTLWHPFTHPFISPVQ